VLPDYIAALCLESRRRMMTKVLAPALAPEVRVKRYCAWHDSLCLAIRQEWEATEVSSPAGGTGVPPDVTGAVVFWLVQNFYRGRLLYLGSLADELCEGLQRNSE